MLPARTTPRVQARYRRVAQAASSGVELGLLRSDYMVDAPTRTLLQVEVNTIAASFACLSALAGAQQRRLRRLRMQHLFHLGAARTGRMHRHLVQRAGLEQAYPLAAMPENGALEGMAAGLAAAWKQVTCQL